MILLGRLVHSDKVQSYHPQYRDELHYHECRRPLAYGEHLHEPKVRFVLARPKAKLRLGFEFELFEPGTQVDSVVQHGLQQLFLLVLSAGGDVDFGGILGAAQQMPVLATWSGLV